MSVKAGIDVELSMAAVAALKITKAEALFIYSPKNNPYYSLMWQDTQYAHVQVIPGFPETTETMYFRGWSHAFADKMYLNCGDMIWLAHIFYGLGDITYVEKYEARMAVQRTGEPPISQECCEDA